VKEFEEFFRVQIFSLTPNICQLIRKMLEKYNFKHDCIRINEDIISDPKKFCSQRTFLDSLDSLVGKLDCIILDKDIDSAVKQIIVEKFNKTDIICLPSLNEPEILPYKNVKHISEPFRLSELEEVLLELYNNKKKSETDTDT
jgi:hypothetical protein